PRCCRAIYHTYTHPLSLHDALPISIKAKKRPGSLPGRATQPCRLEHVRDEVEISSCGFLQPPALSFGESPPDTEAFVMLQRILQALRSYLARLADLLRLPCRAALLGKERLRVGLRAQGTFLPAQIFVRAVRQRDHLAHAHLLLPPIDVPGPFVPPGPGGIPP